MRNRKSQGLSLNVIIVAAIVLVVLIVLWSIFTGKIGGFSKELQECRGQCLSEDVCKYPKGVKDPQAECGNRINLGVGYYQWNLGGNVCCILLENE